MHMSAFLRSIRLLFLFFSFSTLTYGQDTQGSNDQNVSLNPSQLGSLQNSVNLYTGQVGFPMTVASLPGRGGLAPQVTIQYNSSGVKQMVNTWNREAPTGVIGLGWSLEFPRIICDHNQTGTRHDDTFYLVEGGATYQMLCTDDDYNGSRGYRTYELKSYQPWRIRYYYLTEKWVIDKGDGATYVYGDEDRTRADGTIQYMIRWGNWIGDSKETSGQEEHAYIWNLSEVVNLWNDKLIYSYDNIEEEVGFHTDPGNPNNPRHTKASVLERITGPTGNYIELNYAMKTYESCPGLHSFRCTDKIREYQDPHVELNAEPDAYQEKYEPRYLTDVKAYNENETLLYQVRMEYDQDQWIGQGEMTKRVLTSVQRVNHTGKALPTTEFEYYKEKEDPFKGYLQRVTNSIGGEISYSYTSTKRFPFTSPGYEQYFSEVGTRDIKVVAPPGLPMYDTFTEPDLFFGPDYVVVLWRAVNTHYLNHFPFGESLTYISEPRPSYVQIYTWEGEWVKQDIGSIGELRLSHDIDKHEIRVTLQKNHFALLLKQQDKNFIINLFHKNSGKRGWEHYSENFTMEYGRGAEAQYLGELFLTSGSNHVAFSSQSSDRLFFYTWRGASWHKSIKSHTSPAGYSYAGHSNYIIAHNTRTDMAPGIDHFWFYFLSENGVWREKPFPGNFNAGGNYSTRRRDNYTIWHSSPSFALVMADDNPEYIFKWDTEYENITRETLFKVGDRDPVYWRSNSLFNVSNKEEKKFEGLTYSTFLRYNGKDWLKEPIGLFKFLSPSNIVNNTFMIKGTSDVIGLSRGSSQIALKRYDANAEVWNDLEITTSEPRFDRYIQLIPEAALMGKSIYYNEPDGSWYNIGEISALNHGKDSWKYGLRAGKNTFYSSIPYNRTEINRVKNGTLSQRYMYYNNMDSRQRYYDIGGKLVGNEMFAAFPVSNPRKYNATRFWLYKWSDDDFQGGHEAVIVSAIHVNDGNLNIGKSYAYDYYTARMDASGRFPLFNEVKVVNGSNNPSAYPRGYTQYYFHNGRPLSDISNAPTEQVSDKTLLFAGNLYRKEIYNNLNELVLSTETIYKDYSRSIYNNYVHYARPIKSISKEYLDTGTKTLVTNTSYNYNGLPIEIEKTSSVNEGLAAIKEVTTLTYMPSHYNF